MNDYCYVVIQESHPVEVFLTREDAVIMIQKWTGEYPSEKATIYRCPLTSNQTTYTTLLKNIISLERQFKN